MRLWRRRDPAPITATNATPPTYATIGDFVTHALRNPANGWYEPLPAGEKIGTVDRCLQMTSQEIANMPLRYRHSATAAPFEPSWVHDPDPAWFPNGIAEAVFAAVWSIYAYGEAFLYATSRYETGWPRTWTLLNPLKVRVADGGGYRVYESNQTELDERDVLHVRRDPGLALRGRPALEAYWSNVTSAAAAEAYAADVYFETGVNRVALKSKHKLDPQNALQLQADWASAVTRRGGAPAILPPELDLLETLSISPKDMLLLESREWDAKQIATAFGVPAILLNMTLAGGLTYQNPAQLYEIWWKTELMPRAGFLQAALSRWLPRGHWVEFSPAQILKPDLPQMVDTFSKALADKAITVDEYRAAVFDLPPMPTFGDEAAELFEEAGAHGSTGVPPLPEEVLMP